MEKVGSMVGDKHDLLELRLLVSMLDIGWRGDKEGTMVPQCAWRRVVNSFGSGYHILSLFQLARFDATGERYERVRMIKFHHIRIKRVLIHRNSKS